VRIETASPVKLLGNVARDMAESLVDVGQGNLHLNRSVEGVSQAAARLEQAPQDVDGQPRPNPCDVGADQRLAR
jgi:hypothetical protein